MMKIEWVMGVEWLTSTTQRVHGHPSYTATETVVYINYPVWMELTKEQKTFVLAHEKLHTLFSRLHRYDLESRDSRDSDEEMDWNEEMEMDGDEDVFESRDSKDQNHDTCPMCGNAETCESCGGAALVRCIEATGKHPGVGKSTTVVDQPETRELWVNVYENFETIHDCKWSADHASRNYSNTRIACVPVTVTFKRGQNLEE